MSETVDPRQRFLFSTLPGLLSQAYDYVRSNPLQATADVAQAVTPGGALQDALAGSEQISRSALRGDIGGMVGGAGAMGAGLLGAIPIAGMAGRAMRGFHGSPYEFKKFDLSRAGTTTDEGALGRAGYFTTDLNAVTRNTDSGPVWPFRYEADLNIQNPLELKFPDWFADKRVLVREALGLPKDSSADEVTNKLLSRGHDSVILDYSPVNYHQKEIAVLDDRLIDIIRRFGLLGTVGAGAAMAGAQEMQQ